MTAPDAMTTEGVTSCYDCGRPRPAATAAILAGWYVEYGENNTLCPLCYAEETWQDYIGGADCPYWLRCNGTDEERAANASGICGFGCYEEPACITDSWGRDPLRVWPDMEPYVAAESATTMCRPERLRDVPVCADGDAISVEGATP